MATAVPGASHQGPFQTVYFRFIPIKYFKCAKATIESIYGGAVQRIRLHPHGKSKTKKYAFVTFESPEVAARAVSGTFFWPNGGQPIQVKKADDWHQPIELKLIADTLQNAPHQPTAFDVLNADCLLHLYKYLGPLDIAHASEAIPCLLEFASENIYHKHTKMNIFAQIPSNQNEKAQFSELLCLLRHYGQHLTHCFMNGSHLKRPTATHIRTVLKNCPNLMLVRLQNLQLSTSDLKHLMKEKLQASELEWINNDVPSMFDRWTDSIFNKWAMPRSLTIHGYPPGVDLTLTSLRNMEKLSLANCYGLDDELVVKIVQKNGATLKSLSLVDVYDVEYDELFSKLPELAPNLEHLKIHIEEPTLMYRMHELKHLKHLQIVEKPNYFASEGERLWDLEPFTQLEELDLVLCSAAPVKAAAKVTSLRVLSLRQPELSSYDVIFETVASLPNLKRLYLSKFSGWSTVDTVKVLEANQSLEEIVLHFPSYSTPAVELLIDCLKKQPARATVRLSQFNDFQMIEMDDAERKLLKDNRHLLRLHVEKSKFSTNDDMEEGDDYVPEEDDDYIDDDFDGYSDMMGDLDDEYSDYSEYDEDNMYQLEIDGNQILNHIMFGL